MRSFNEIEKSLFLKKFLSSNLGTLFFTSRETPSSLMVRYFDSALDPKYLSSYAEMVQACQIWIEKFPKLSSLARVEQPVEVGKDFIARPFHVYLTSTETYAQDENPTEAPEELKLMRDIFCESIKLKGDLKDELMKSILARNLLQPSFKTYFDGKKFIIIEPSFKAEEIKIWSTLGSQ